MKRKSHFQFKQFSVRHDRCSMKVGTDAVLLGSWADVNGAATILDIGTGSGVIALMLAQRTASQTKIDAVEMEATDSRQASENFLQSPWADRIAVHELPIQEFFPSIRYDLIVTNPPYFINSHRPPDPRRYATRHTIALDYETLLLSVVRLLDSNGKFNVILPDPESSRFMSLASEMKFYCTRKYCFRTRKQKPVERWLLEFSFHDQDSVDTGEILLYKDALQWSQTYIDLTREFYLYI